MTQHRGFISARPGIAHPSLPLVLAAAWLWAGPARAEDASAWVAAAHSEARIVAGGTAPAGPEAQTPARLLAGIEIRLAPEFITYWRDPGDAGVPPSFDFGGSANLASAEVRYPAPRALDEAGAKAFGYLDDVVFPVLVTPIDATKPVRLRVRVDYAACHDICLPARADLGLVLTAEPTRPGEAGLAREALAEVPRRSALGDRGGPVRVAAIRAAADGFSVEAEGAEGGTLFIEAPEGWAYETGGPSISRATGTTVFPVKRVDGPKGQEAPSRPVVLTLVAPAGAVEVPVQLDGSAAKP